MSWKISLTSTPRLIRSSRAATMSSTIRCRPSALPGSAFVTPLPKMIDAGDPGGVSWVRR